MSESISKLTENRIVQVVWIAFKLALVIQFAQETVRVIYQGF
jgi:hypothetical protein